MSQLFGSVIQQGYVVPDVEAAMRHWIDRGVGPFFVEELRGLPALVDGKSAEVALGVRIIIILHHVHNLKGDFCQGLLGFEPFAAEENSPHIEKKMPSGRRPAPSRRIFSSLGMSRSSFGRTGPRAGFTLQRIVM